MRSAFLVLAVACALQGCTLVGAGLAADTNRQRRFEATTSGLDLVTRPPTPGDALAVRLTNGERVRGAFVALSSDSLVLAGTGPVALVDVDRVERPWKQADTKLMLVIGAALDAAVIWYVSRLPWSGTGGGGLSLF